jgi:hypothetical protein
LSGLSHTSEALSRPPGVGSGISDEAAGGRVIRHPATSCGIVEQHQAEKEERMKNLVILLVLVFLISYLSVTCATLIWDFTGIDIPPFLLFAEFFLVTGVALFIRKVLR